MKLFAKRTTELDDMIKRELAHLSALREDPEEYAKAFANVERLYRLRKETRGDGISPDTAAIVAGNLLGILIMVAYEQKHVITSKSLGFLIKSRID